MILLSFLIKKFEYIRPLLNDLRKLVNYTNDRALGKKRTSDISNTFVDSLQSIANIQIYLKNIKEISQTLLSQAEHQRKDSVFNSEYSDEEDANDPFLRNFRQNEDDEIKNKQEQNEDSQKSSEEFRKKMNQFLILWLRQIVIYNTHYVLHLSMTSQNLVSILDVKPSIVKATNIKYALLSLMNPRLQSFQQVNNFKSMKRILDNIVTYFFQNFLSVKERGLISDDLRKISINPSNLSQCHSLDIIEFFDCEDEFKKFYEFMDMSYYISNVHELDLSLIKHSNKDLTPPTLKRVYNVYRNGVQIYKQHGVHITQFCFDNCENDI